MVTAMIDGASGLNFSIDLNTIMLALIAGLISIVGWFTRKWGFAIETQIKEIHIDMKEHNDRSDKTHESIFKEVNQNRERVAKLEGRR